MSCAVQYDEQSASAASGSDGIESVARDPIGRSLKLAAWLSRAPMPRQLDSARAVAKKLAWTAYEAQLVDAPARYAYHELFRPAVRDYKLRHSGTQFAIRHGTGDVDIFRKFYAYRYYEWPVEVVAKLRRLRRPIKTLDLGANIGFFEVHAREQLPVGRAVAFEPDPANGRMFERVRDANAVDWEIVKACASNRDGSVLFRSGAHNFSRIASDGDYEVPALDVFPYIAEADLVKMNIEGSEWEILEDPRLAATSQVWIVEYHRIRNPEPDITTHVRRLFERSGYTTQIATSHRDNGLVWAWMD
jgi:FkbM family methyltransferase